ncbi:hypothetical protein [Agromyces rhizosphaerae]|uniref:hypothetical protein n=1 Tax=Agromyces rhizosphaerae TaxID=88374 RepID=UPI0024908EF0|nr:hypothetical protein [Agromyces rhizosphaerae]
MDDAESASQDYLESLPIGTVIQVTDPSGHHFWLEAESRAFRDFVLHKGVAPRGFQGHVSRYGRHRRFWPTSLLARWAATGLCRIELASPPANGADR